MPPGAYAFDAGTFDVDVFDCFGPVDEVGVSTAARLDPVRTVRTGQAARTVQPAIIVRTIRREPQMTT